MSMEAKTNFLRAWLVRKPNPKTNDLMADIYRSNQFHDLKNRKMVEIELFSREIIKTVQEVEEISEINIAEPASFRAFMPLGLQVPRRDSRSANNFPKLFHRRPQ